MEKLNIHCQCSLTPVMQICSFMQQTPVWWKEYSHWRGVGKTQRSSFRIYIHKIICSRHHKVKTAYLKVEFPFSDATSLNHPPAVVCSQWHLIWRCRRNATLSWVRGLVAAANPFHLTANECLSAVFTKHAILLKTANRSLTLNWCATESVPIKLSHS